MDKKRPLVVMSQTGVTREEKQAALEGVEELLDIAGVDLVLMDLDGRHDHADNYVEYAKQQSDREGKVQVEHLLSCLIGNPIADKRYQLLIVKEDLYTPNSGFVIGTAVPGWGTAISTLRFRGVEGQERLDCVATEAMHEMGHVFGLPDKSRKDLDYEFGPHCANKCVMRQGMRVPRDWQSFTQDRKDYGPLCKVCTKDLIAYFE